MAHPLSSVALCVVGLLSRLSPDRAGLKEVAKALEADVFLLLSRNEGEEVPGDLFDWAADVSLPPNAGPSVLRLDARRADPSGKVIKALDKFQHKQFLEPLLVRAGQDGPPDTNAYQLRDCYECFQKVRGREFARRVRYRYVVYTRGDTFWFSTLPPLNVLESINPSALWIPDGQDSDGFNDRMAIVPRKWADIYFGRWHLLINGSLLPGIRQGMGKKVGAGAEWLLYVALRQFRVPVLRFSAVAAIQCIEGIKPNHGACTRPFHMGSTKVQFKYSQEAGEAMFAARMLSRAWEWRPALTPWISPSCFTSTAEAYGCCDEDLNGWGGVPECFNDVWMFWRCCGAGAYDKSKFGSGRPWLWSAPANHDMKIDGLFVMAPPHLMQQHIGEGMVPLCWRTADAGSRCVNPYDFVRRTELELRLPERPWTQPGLLRTDFVDDSARRRGETQESLANSEDKIVHLFHPRVSEAPEAVPGPLDGGNFALANTTATAIQMQHEPGRLSLLKMLVETEKKYTGGGSVTDHDNWGGDRMGKGSHAQGGMNHNYAPVFATFIWLLLRTVPVPTIAEIGILKGTGLAAWATIFPHSAVYGFDHITRSYNENRANMKALGFNDQHVRVFHINQAEGHDEESAAQLRKVFDDPSAPKVRLSLVIDDGLHTVAAGWRTLTWFWPYLDKHFVYFVEDIRLHEINNGAWNRVKADVEGKCPECYVSLQCPAQSLAPTDWNCMVVIARLPL
eukprot:TRINITY_DN35736_c0_g1_i1.p1 TRINITY_DN35736_c0_g1~~TRINITY_DN35736_c0_g1_i1.p1  ORF type:complete len:734 (+),score=84.43 TRINITY_DN35736_c0_g1_i1:85-2286(+)